MNKDPSRGQELGGTGEAVATSDHAGVGPLRDRSGQGHPVTTAGAETSPLWVTEPIDTNRCLYTRDDATSYAMASDSAAMAVTGDLDIRADLRPDDWNAVATAFGTKFYAEPYFDSYEVGVWGGNAFFEWTDPSGEEHYYDIAPQADSVGRARFRFTLEVDDGAGRHVVRAYRGVPSPEADEVTADGAGWDVAQEWVLPGTTAVVPSDYPLTISGPYDQGRGRTCRLQVFDGIDGTPVADFYPDRDATPVATTMGERDLG